MGQPAEATTNRIEARFLDGEAYEFAVRDHRVRVDQPVGDGGDDSAPTPVELLIGALATCVAFYAGRYLTRHGLSRDGLRVSGDFTMATDRPARVATVRLIVHAPADLPADRRAALLATAAHCTVENTLATPADVTVDLA
ncbi:OsmC family protein [Micromonospora sp. KC723]|uniref:OsmC family protein n=1 Tax=Micromonospora sp. KC723 TaxID=2530381 RepID=UPI001043B4B5|nr:OsmC family protein [Micromonospora sp. KC723]TDB72041.1 OsmC family peroxiredoxin [Micromonospora sp. KC723]